jgi:hypothetical protein
MHWRCSILLLAVFASRTLADPPDYTKAKPKDLGINPVKPTKDPRTGFVVGGKNPTALIRKLKEIAGRPIVDLEKDMRPGAHSGKGLPGKDERLLDVLAEDNRYVVDKLGLTHQELARHLHLVAAVAVKHACQATGNRLPRQKVAYQSPLFAGLPALAVQRRHEGQLRHYRGKPGHRQEAGLFAACAVHDRAVRLLRGQRHSLSRRTQGGRVRV